MKIARSGIASIALLAAGCAAVAGFEPLVFEEATGTDAGNDGSTNPSPDGSTSGNDAANDAAMLDAGPRAPASCSKYGKHDFCDEFASTIDISDAGWTENPVFGASLTRDQDSLLGVIPDQDGGPSVYAALRLSRPWSVTSAGRPVATAHALMKVEECPWYTTILGYYGGGFSSARYYGYIELATDRERGRCEIGMSNIERIDGSEYGLGVLRTQLALGVWHDIGFALTENATGTTVSFLLDDKLVTTIEIEAKASTEEIGIVFGVNGPALGGRVRLDDFRADWLPK